MRTSCRSCGGRDLIPVLALGSTPLANALLASPGAAEERVPLDLVFCRECALAQIIEDVSPELLFRDYVYFSSFSDTVLENARAVTERLIEERDLGRDTLVIEIASNDGYLLHNYVARGVPVLGIEPARNVAAVARAKGIETVEEFFTCNLAVTLPHAHIIHANNVLAHVADLNGFIAGLSVVLEDEGMAVIEVPYVRDLVEGLEFDTIYHEHLCYFSVTALGVLFSRHGLSLWHVERIPIHGGSLRLFAGRARKSSAAVGAFLREEEALGFASGQAFLAFGERVRTLCTRLREGLRELKSEGKSVAAYGASAKGTTLLSFTGIGSETLDFVADRSPIKQGRFTPGTHLQIVAPEELIRRMPDYVLLLAWNFAPEIIDQQEEYRKMGGRFIIPIPDLSIV